MLQYLIEFMYLDFLNKKVKNTNVDLNLNLILLSSYVDMANIFSFLKANQKNKGANIKKYLWCDKENKYFLKRESAFKELKSELDDKKKLDILNKEIKNRADKAGKQIIDCGYINIYNQIYNK